MIGWRKIQDCKLGSWVGYNGLHSPKYNGIKGNKRAKKCSLKRERKLNTLEL